MAALVHDVGRSVDDEDHPTVGARMIQRETSLRLKKRHRRALAYLTLRHRGAVPELGHDSALRSSDDARRLRLLLGFLRTADCFDSRSLPSPRLSFSRRGRRLQIHCMLREESAKARRVFSRRKKFRLLEETLGCRVEVVISVQRRLRAVA
jgi:exopolyphosphatase/pppGpp-phosphohydrolase